MDRYGRDVLAGNWRAPDGSFRRSRPSRDLVVEDAETGFCGAVVRCEKMPGGSR